MFRSPAVKQYFKTAPAESKLVWVVTAASITFGGLVWLEHFRKHALPHFNQHRRVMLERLNSKYDGQSLLPYHESEGAAARSKLWKHEH